MSGAKKKPAPEKAGVTISNCQISNISNRPDERVCAAVEALANAAKANADAIAAAARALEGSDAPAYGIYVGGAL